MARKAEVIFVGDADSLVAAALRSKAAVKSLQDQASKTSGLDKLPQLGGNITTALGAAAPAVAALSGALGGLAASATAAAGGAGAVAVGGIGALAVGLGSIALVAKPAVANFQKVTTALDAYNLTLAKHGTTAKQAQAAQAKLNAVVSQNGGAPVLAAAKAWDALGESFQKLSAPAQQTMFKTFSAGLATIKTLLPTVAGIANKSMKALSDALTRPMSLFTGSEFKGILKSLGDTFAKAIGPGMNAVALSFLAFSRIAKAAGPYVVQLADAIQKLAVKFAQATADPQKLQGIIAKLVDNAKSWAKLIGAVGKLIFDVFKQGVASGKGMVDSLTQVVKTWDQWVKSGKGSQDITKFFHESAQFAKELFAALGPVVKAITAMSVGPLPIYVKLMGDLKGIMGPLTYAFIGYKAALIAATIAEGVFTVATKAAAATMWLVNDACIATRIGLVALAVQEKATAAATFLLDAAMDANPIVLIGAAIAALAAGVIYLATQTHVLTDAWNFVKKVTSEVWDWIKGHLGVVIPAIALIVTGPIGATVALVVTHWTDIKKATVSIWTDIKKWLSGAWDDITKGIGTFATGVKDAIVGVFDGAVNTVIGFVNDIIGAIDIIPGVHIKKIGLVGGSSSSGAPKPNGQGGGGNSLGVATGAGGHRIGRARGGLVDHPMVMVGEEGPQHPEYVIPTNPAYRARALGLFSGLGKDLGIPGYSIGGIIDSVSGAVGGAASAVGGAASSVASGALNLATKGAGWLIGQLPGVGSLPSWLTGMGKSILGDVGHWIKKQIGGLFGGGGSGSGGGPSGAQGPVPAGSARDWLTKALMITNHFSPANLAALYSRMMQESGGNPHAINLWDSNAVAGHPSKGLLQTIDSTFASYALPGLGDIWNPIANAVAAIRYMFARYGHVVGASGSGYAKGGILPFKGSFAGGGLVPGALGSAGLAVVHGGEMVLPTGVNAGAFSPSAFKGLLYPIDAALRALAAAEQTASGARLKALQSIDTKLNQLKAFKDAIAAIKDQTKQLASQAAQAFQAARQGHINTEHDKKIAAIQNGPIAKQLAAMQSQDAAAQDAATFAGLQKNLTDAQTLAANSGGQTHLDALQQVKDAQDAITQYHRQKTEQQLQDEIDTATRSADAWQTAALSSVDQQTKDYEAGLNAQFDVLNNELKRRKITYAQWAADVNAILAQYGLTVTTDSSTEGAVTAGPGAAAATGGGGPKTTVSIVGGAIKAHPLWGGHRASGGPVMPGYVYRVGEHGPEDVAFGRPGVVMTAAQTRRGGGDVHIHGNLNVNSHRAAKSMADRLAFRAALGTA